MHPQTTARRMKKLGIIAGGGRMPVLLAESCAKQGRPYFVLVLEGYEDNALLTHHEYQTVRLGAIGEAVKILKKNQVEEVILAGHVNRPTLSSLRPDLTATMLLAKYGNTLFAGDDALLGVIIEFMEKEGFGVVGAEDILHHLLMPAGVLGKHKPNKQHLKDIARGLTAARTLGDLDIGQAVVVENGYVLAVEAAEGTEKMLSRLTSLTQHETGHGVLIKAKKPTQDTRADLPAIGLDTIQQAYEAGLAGIAVEAGSSLILDRDDMIELANQLGIFVAGISDE